MKIKEMNEEEKPREKLLANGVKALTDSELLAIMLGSGTKEESVLELSSKLINKYGLSKLFNMSFDELSKIKGIKEAKATKLMSAFEIARRCIKEERNIKKPLLCKEDVYDFIKGEYAFINYEMLSLVYVNCKCVPIEYKTYSNSLSHSVSIPYREIINEAIMNKCYGIFLIHNHPTGDNNPSKEDIESTEELEEILIRLNIILLDHIILSNGNYLSLNEYGLLK